MVDCELIDDQCFTHPLVIMDLNRDPPMPTPQNSMAVAWARGTPIARRIQKQSQDITDKISHVLCNTNTNALYIIKKRTEKLL